MSEVFESQWSMFDICRWNRRIIYQVISRTEEKEKKKKKKSVRRKICEFEAKIANFDDKIVCIWVRQ